MDNDDYDLLGKCRKILQDLLDEDSKYDNLMHEEEIDQVRLNILKDDLNAFSTINHNSAKNINSEKSSRIRQINSNNSPNINESAQNSQYSSQNGNEPIVKLKNLNNLNNDMFYLLDQNQQNLKSLNFNGQQSYNQSKIPQIRQIPQKEKRKGQPNQRNKKSARSQSIRKIQQLKTKYMNIKTILDQNDKTKRFEDLYQKNTQSSIRKQKDYQDNYQSSVDHLFTFKPQIDPVSNIIAQNSMHDESTLNKSSSSFQHSLYLKGLTLIEQKQQKIDNLKTIKERQLKQECTFQPNFHKIKGRNTQRFNYLTRDEERSIDNLYERGLKFVEDKRQRIVMEKKKLQNQSMIECSFKPKLQLSQNQSPVRKFRKAVKHIQKDKNFKLESSVLEERSVRQFLIRQEKAKELEEIKQKELNKVNGSKWKRACG
ncbi:UNKNOWN [Stylonychia lemnae]|uniref:Uncharacterized protein n=1 Tax=Stylonychia lemnae TaxID=5949 RepID=A0A077ZRT2_STYLE|nr:UNKNOWN [Stylonychia lemnae]|eukprot:CDW71201.1 UNKNOWN [Stylonychia lemnae]